MGLVKNSIKSAPECSNEKYFLDKVEKNVFKRGVFVRAIFISVVGLGLRRIGFSSGTGHFPAVLALPSQISSAEGKLKHYYAHDAVLDHHGVIAPWYRQLNGQCDFRIRIAAETMKRYPWTTTEKAAVAYPDYLFTSNWAMAPDGTITTKHYGDWSNGDLGQRAYGVLEGMTDYYRYSGDPAAIAHLNYMGDYLLDYSLTPEDHPWPGFPVSVPTKGKAYGKADPKGMIQLDISAAIGERLLRAYQVTKKPRWLEAVKHWGDLLARNCNVNTEAPPWPRYANPENLKSQNHPSIEQWFSHPRMNLQTGSVVMILNFLDELIRFGYRGLDQQIVKAREAGIRYLRDQLLPEWTLDKTWGCNFWDWIHDMQESSITAYVANYLIKNKEEFPNWRNDARNILTLFLNRSSADPKSGGDVYSGAWAYPESSMCCGRSLWYAPLSVGAVMAKYGVEADDALMKELGYRQMILQTYDIHENGVSEDNIDGGVIVNNEWLNIAVPFPLLALQQAIAWLPEELGASRENHLVRSSAVVDAIVYGKDLITYSTFDAPLKTIDVFRLSYVPASVFADKEQLHPRSDLKTNGYTIKTLRNGDAIVSIRHDGKKNIMVKGSDPQQVLNYPAFQYEGNWILQIDDAALTGAVYTTDEKGASATAAFYGNQLRLTGRVDQWGGEADVFIDGVKQQVFIDCWNPTLRGQQVLYYKNGLEQGNHYLKIVARGSRNPYAMGNKVYIDSLQFSQASGIHGFPSGTGPTSAQRMIFGYTKRQDYRDSRGRLWRPATEMVTPLSKMQDTVEKCWMKRSENRVSNTKDPELYRYGCSAREFWVNVTVGPGKYGVRLKFAATKEASLNPMGFDILINEKTLVSNFNVVATANGINRAVDLVFKDVSPLSGIIQIRFKSYSAEAGNAFVQALEIDRDLQGKGAVPVTFS